METDQNPLSSGPIIPLDKLPGSAFKWSHPIDFALFDANNHYALYIDDSNALGQPLTLELKNTSTRPIVLLRGQGNMASAMNYHFELQFRQGVLSVNTLSRLRDPGQKSAIIADHANWDVFVPTEVGPADHVSLYLLHKDTSTWSPNSLRILRFTGINADAAGGARGTQVSLALHQLAYVGSEALLTGSRTQHLSIINHQGEQDIPLHVGLKGSNHVVNVNAAENTLILQIVNHLRLAQTHSVMPAILLAAPSDAQPTSRFFLEFDVQQEGEEKAWALAKAGEMSGLTLAGQLFRRGQSVPDTEAKLHITASEQAISRQWEIRPAQDISLQQGDMIQLSLSGLISSLPAGPTNLYLHYENISGYQSGRIIVPLIKSPLTVVGSQIGIGTTTPTAGLTIDKGNTNETALTLTSSGPGWGSGIRFNNTASNGRNYGVYSDPGGALRFADDNLLKDRMVIHANGAVLFGPNDSWGATLQVGGSGRVSTHASVAATDGNLHLDAADGNHATYINHYSKNPTYINLQGGAVAIGGAYAASTGFMAGGSLTIGNTSQNYGGGTGQWNNNTAGLMLECATNTEIAVHDSHTRVASLMYYEGDTTNRITIGRDMGWGKTNVLIAGSLSVEGQLAKKFTRWWSLEIAEDRDWGNTRIGLITNAQWQNSDARLKKEIEPIPGALEKVSLLSGVTYQWSPEGKQHLTRHLADSIFAGPGASEEENQRAKDEARQEAYRILEAREVGLLAQDVEKVLPELVRTDAGGYKSVRYDLLSALLVEAVKDLSRQVEEMKHKRQA